MRNLQKGLYNGSETGKASGEIQPNHQKKKISQSPMDTFA